MQRNRDPWAYSAECIMCACWSWTTTSFMSKRLSCLLASSERLPQLWILLFSIIWYTEIMVNSLHEPGCIVLLGLKFCSSCRNLASRVMVWSFFLPVFSIWYLVFLAHIQSHPLLKWVLPVGVEFSQLESDTKNCKALLDGCQWQCSGGRSRAEVLSAGTVTGSVWARCQEIILPLRHLDISIFQPQSVLPNFCDGGKPY